MEWLTETAENRFAMLSQYPLARGKIWHQIRCRFSNLLSAPMNYSRKHEQSMDTHHLPDRVNGAF